MYTRLCHSGSSYSIIIKLPSLPHLQSLLLATFLAREEEKVDLQLLKATFCLFVCFLVTLGSHFHWQRLRKADGAPQSRQQEQYQRRVNTQMKNTCDWSSPMPTIVQGRHNLAAVSSHHSVGLVSSLKNYPPEMTEQQCLILA